MTIINTPLVLLAQQCGATYYTPGPMRAIRGMAFTFDQLDALAERLRAEAGQHAEAPGAAAPMSPADAMAVLKAAFAADPEYAWSWHCAAWSCAHDEGLPTDAANRAAARLMYMAFGCDTSKNQHFCDEHRVAAPAVDAGIPDAGMTVRIKLQHLYTSMTNGTVRDAASSKRMAEGLLGPAIDELVRAELEARKPWSPDEGRAGPAAKATGPLPGIAGGSS